MEYAAMNATNSQLEGKSLMAALQATLVASSGPSISKFIAYLNCWNRLFERITGKAPVATTIEITTSIEIISTCISIQVVVATHFSTSKHGCSVITITLRGIIYINCQVRICGRNTGKASPTLYQLLFLCHTCRL